MNSYEEKLEARRARYEEKAHRLREEAHRIHEDAHTMASVIPMGQPIIVGHYSEARDRRYRERIQRKYAKAFETMDKADYYEQKAASVGNGGISSDDPDALVKLREKLERMRSSQDFMKKANAAIRKAKTQDARIEALMELGATAEEAKDILTPDCFGIIGFAPFSLRNNNANIRRVEQRIRELERAASTESVVKEGDGYTYREDTSENRIMFIFPGKPDEETRDILKQNGFRWSPRRKAWVRMLNTHGKWAAENIMEKLNG